MKEKKLIPKTLPEGADLFEEIYGFMKQDSWVFITAELFWRLRREYPCQFAELSDRCRFSVEKHNKSWILTVYKDCEWNKVESLAAIDWENSESYCTSDPEKVVFLE